MRPTAARRARQAVAGGTAARRDQGHTPGLASGCVGRGARRSLWTRATKMCFLGLAATGVSSAGGQQLAPAAKGARAGRRMMPWRRGETWRGGWRRSGGKGIDDGLAFCYGRRICAGVF